MYSSIEIVTAVGEQNPGKPAALLEIGALYFVYQLGQMKPFIHSTYRIRFSNLIGGGWCDIVLDTRKIKKQEK
ncbi:MAG: hypothetical protein J6B91_09225 [Prevotella sp.]|nr:hypothetical protein [Prevotella sp.]